MTDTEKQAPSASVSSPPSARDSVAFDLDAIARAAAASRSFVLAGLALAALIVIGGLLLTRLTVPAVQNFQIGLRFVFPEAANGRYPNQSQFAVQDIIASDLVARVHAQNNLEKHGVSVEEFASSVAVAPYALDRELILARYTKRLDDPKLSFVERQKVESDLRDELARSQGRAAVLMFTIDSRFGLSEVVGLKALRDLVATWSQSRIADYGVLQLPEAQRTADLIDIAQLVGQNPVVAASQLESFTTNLRETLQRLHASDGAKTLVDDTNGKTVASLIDDLYQFEQFAVPQLFLDLSAAVPAAQRQQGIRVLQQRISVFKRQEQLERGRADAIATALQAGRDRRQADDPGDAVASEPVPSGAGGGLAPQLSEGFLDRIIGLSGDAASREFRETLTSDEIRLRRSAIEMANAQARIRAQIDIFSTANIAALDNTRVADAAGQAFDRTKPAHGDANLSSLAANLNEIAAVTQRLFARLSATNRGYGGMLVQMFDVENHDAYTLSHPILNTRVLLTTLAGLAGIALLLLAAGILWHLTAALRARSPS